MPKSSHMKGRIITMQMVRCNFHHCETRGTMNTPDINEAVRAFEKRGWAYIKGHWFCKTHAGLMRLEQTRKETIKQLKTLSIASLKIMVEQIDLQLDAARLDYNIDTIHSLKTDREIIVKELSQRGGVAKP